MATKLSIAIPTYNRNAYLSDLLHCIYALPTPEVEVFVVDSGGSSAPVQEHFPDTPFYPFPNHTVAEMFNECIHRAQGDYLNILHDDDIISPAYIRTYLYIINKYPRVGLFWSAGELINEHYQQLGRLCFQEHSEYFPPLTLFSRLRNRNLIAASAACVNRHCYESLGPFQNLTYALDYEMWLRISLHYAIYYHADPLWFYRLHPTNLTKRLPPSLKQEEEQYIHFLYDPITIKGESPVPLCQDPQ